MQSSHRALGLPEANAVSSTTDDDLLGLGGKILLGGQKMMLATQEDVLDIFVKNSFVSLNP